MKKGYVAVCLPSFNRVGTLKEVVAQILNQTYEKLELIIYDDGSEDGSVDFLNSITDKRVKVFCEKHKGAPSALCYFLSQINSEYYIVLHDHDFFSKDLIKKCVDVLKNNESVAAVLPGSSNIDSDGKSNKQRNVVQLSNVSSGKVLVQKHFNTAPTYNSIFHACMMFRTSLIKHREYPVEYGIFADLHFTLMNVYESNVAYINEDLITFRRRDKNHFLNGKETQNNRLLFKLYYSVGNKLELKRKHFVFLRVKQVLSIIFIITKRVIKKIIVR